MSNCILTIVVNRRIFAQDLSGHPISKKRPFFSFVGLIGKVSFFLFSALKITEQVTTTTEQYLRAF